MVKSSGKKSKEKKGTSQKETNVVHFVDYVNYYEVAAIICEKVNDMCVNSKELSFVAAEGGFDTASFAAVLEDFIEVEMLNELMQTPFGQGILTGIYMSHVGEAAIDKEVEQLEAEESYD